MHLHARVDEAGDLDRLGAVVSDDLDAVRPQSERRRMPGAREPENEGAPWQGSGVGHNWKRR